MKERTSDALARIIFALICVGLFLLYVTLKNNEEVTMDMEERAGKIIQEISSDSTLSRRDCIELLNELAEGASALALAMEHEEEKDAE